jgi:hypothetical protein
LIPLANPDADHGLATPPSSAHEDRHIAIRLVAHVSLQPVLLELVLQFLYEAGRDRHLAQLVALADDAQHPAAVLGSIGQPIVDLLQISAVCVGHLRQAKTGGVQPPDRSRAPPSERVARELVEPLLECIPLIEGQRSLEPSGLACSRGSATPANAFPSR